MAPTKARERHPLDELLGVETRAEDEESTHMLFGSHTPSEHVLALTDQSPAPAEFENLTGSLVDGRYRVLRILGAGGIGLVYLCQHQLSGKPVAMKVLRPEYVSHQDLNERFLIEARAASSIKSPHIVETIGVGTLPSGAPYFVMDYVNGETLASLLDREPRLDVHRTLEIARQISKGLAAAHAAGVVHRDLKPENVFLAPKTDGGICVKLFDFGIAKVAGQKKRLTYVGAVFGTPTYMSPEQARGDTVDGRADLYALGVMLFEMLTGTVPFDGEEPLVIMAQHVERTPPSLAELSGGSVPAQLEAIVLRCMEKSPAQRYPSAAALLADLDAVDPNGPTSVSIGQTPLPSQATLGTLQPHVVPTAAPKPHRSRAVRIGTLAAALLGGGALLAAYQAGSSRAGAVPTGAVAAAATPAPLKGRAPLRTPARQAAPKPQAVERARTSESSSEREAHEPAVRTVNFVLYPRDAKLFHGERELGQAPVSLDVKEGESVTLTVRRKGYSTRRVVVDGSQSRVVVGLTKHGDGAPSVRRAPSKRSTRSTSQSKRP